MVVLGVIQETVAWNLPVLAWFLCILFVYVIFYKKSTSSIQPILFFSSLVLLFLLIGSPYVSILELSFSLHMIQMGILYFIIPPLFIAGIPPYMYQWRLKRLKLQNLLSFTFILSIFAILLFMYHIPFIMNVLLLHPPMLLTYKTMLFILACGIWWPMITSKPKNRREKRGLTRYTFLCTLLITPSCLFFIATAFIDSNSHAFFTQFSAHLCIPTSNMNSLLPSFFQSKTDQWLAGVCMFILHSCGVYLTNHLPKETY